MSRTMKALTGELKTLSGALTESELAVTVRESAEQIWLAGLGAYALAQEEGIKVFGTLVKEGEVVQARTRRLADERIASVASKAAGTINRLEKVFEDRVARSLSSLGVPSKQDINRLSKNVAELTSVVHELAEEGTTRRTGPNPVDLALKQVARRSPASAAHGAERQVEHV